MKKTLFFAVSTILLMTSYGQINSGTKNLPPSKFYFYTIYYGFTGDAYVSEIYELELERDDLFKNTKERYQNGISYLTEHNITKEVQSGMEKNYFSREQAENERNYMIHQLAKNYKITTYKYE